MMDLPENYSSKYRNRVYYTNSCNLCFSSENLLKCASCKAVSYCSKQHQVEDWSFHKPTCIALNEIRKELPTPKDPDAESFFKYRRSLLDYLVVHRKLADCSYLTTYERQIFSLPWVCAVCFKKPSPKYECRHCHSITYCSSEHMKKDAVSHMHFCWRLRNCRKVASLSYDNGYKLEAIPYSYKKIRPSSKRWPLDKFELFRLIQNESHFTINDEDFINSSIFLEPYIPAAIILNALEKAGFVRRRYFIQKSSKPTRKIDKKRRKSDKKSQLSTIKSTLTIHFAISDEYELSFQWEEVAQLLSDWLVNVNKVEIVLTGPMLKYCIVPPYESRDKLSGVFVHKMAYQKVDCLTIPDVIVMLECQRSLNIHKDQFWSDEHVTALFRYREVPVILASGDCTSFQKICNILTSFLGVEMTLGVTWNYFTEMDDHREWLEHIGTYSRNSYFAVFSTHLY